MSETERHPLHTPWRFFYHDQGDTNWSRESYQDLGVCTTIEEFWGYQKMMASKLHLGMFFIMRDGIFPLWEDPENKEGGYLSLKILKTKVSDVWEELAGLTLGETLLIPEQRDKWNLINGISVSPKKSFCIFKIWLRDKSLKDPRMYQLPSKPEFTEVLFKAYADEHQH